MQYKVDFESLPWEEPITGLRCKTFKQIGRQIRLIEYSRSLTPHWCYRGHFGYVLEGQMEITFDTGVELYEAGDGVFLPPGEEYRHMARVLTDVVRVIFVEDD
jgi:hypothetical protein